MANYKCIIYIFLPLLIVSCVFTKKIKTGEAAYERKQYAIAVEMLESEFEKQSNKRNRSRTAYLLGKSYNYLEEPELAFGWFKKAVMMEYGNEALLSLAVAYKKAGDYSSSLETYERLKDQSNNKREIDREIYVLKDISKWSKESEGEYKVTALGENSGFSDYSAVVFDKNFLVFTSDRDESTGSGSYNWTGNKHTDLFVMLKNGSTAKRFDAAINSNANEGTACFTRNGQEMIFTRCFSKGDEDGYCKLMYSERFSGIWSEPKELPFLQEGINYGQPTFIENDSVLVFSANIESGSGGHDLYYVEHELLEEGSVSWGDPYLFPATINSKGNEMFPVGDGDTLYFSSDYFAGLGGLDIFKTWLTADGQWSPPQNLKHPINSSFDDFGYYVDYSAQPRGKVVQKGFFTSTRSGDGKEDLYKFERRIITPVEANNAPKEEKVEIEIYLAGKTKEISFEDPKNPNSDKVGTSLLSDCYIVISDGQKDQKVYSDDAGQFIVQLESDKVYRIKASKIGYLNSFETVSTKKLKVEKGKLSTTINVELILNKIFRNVEITLDDIYYNFNKWDIRNDAKPTLDSLSLLLKQNPQINIELSSHTDCRGDDEYNQILSQKRAESAIGYIADKGIKMDRMKPKGYGESRFEINCICDDCTEKEHQANRRTTFKIVE